MSDLLKGLLLAVVLAAAVWDLRVRRIPNWLTAPALLVGIALNAVMTPHGWLVSIGGVACATSVYLPLYIARGMGAGDVKLMAAVGAIAGAANWLVIFLATSLIAGAACLVLIATRRRVGETLRNVGIIVNELLHLRAPAAAHPSLDVRGSGGLRMPHGAFIASGAMLFLIWSRAR